MESTASEPEPSPTASTWPNRAIALATLAWVGASIALFLWMFDLGFNMTGEPHPPEVQAAVDRRERILIVVFTTGPAAIAVFAAVMRRLRTALVYALIALTLCCWLGSKESVRDLFDPPPVEVEHPGNGHCVPISGSDRTCPGG